MVSWPNTSENGLWNYSRQQSQPTDLFKHLRILQENSLKEMPEREIKSKQHQNNWSKKLIQKKK